MSSAGPVAPQSAAPIGIAPVSAAALRAEILGAAESELIAILGAEPEFYDDTLKSLQNGVRTPVQPTRRTLCDALETPCPGELTFPILQANLADVAVVTDAEVAEAVRYAFGTLKLVMEPGGSVALAALLTGKVDGKGKTTAVVVSGGNVDPELFAQILKGEI